MNAEPNPPGPHLRVPGIAGGVCGCIAALVPASAFGFLLVLMFAMGNCSEPDACPPSRRLYFLVALAVLLALSALLGIAVRSIVKWLMLRRLYPVETGGPPIWAFVVALPMLLIVGIGVLQLLMLFTL